MEFNSLPLVSNFNTLYSDVLNCDIVPPSFYLGRVPQAFVLKKRGAFSAVAGAQTFDTIYDIYEDGSDTYYIGKISSNVVVKKGATTLHTSAYVAGVQYKFFFMTAANGTLAESGTLADSATVGPDTVIRDASKAWVTNAYAGKYLYLYENGATAGDTGAGQMFLIDSNDATDLYITNTGLASSTVINASYKIFDKFSSTLSFVAGGFLYVIHNDSTVLPIKLMPSPKDVVFVNGSLYVVSQTNQIFKSDKGYFAMYFPFGSFLGALADVYNILTFQSYILLIGNRSITAIVTQTYSNPSTGAREEVPILRPVSTEYGLFSQGAFTVYNSGLYIVSQNKKFLGVDITNVGLDQFNVQTKNQGIYIQQFLDSIATSDGIKVGINDENIFITVKGSGKSTVYNYDFLYTGWHRWDTLLPLTHFKFNKFIGATLYTKSYDASTDQGSLAYDQNIRAIIGEENIYLMKRAILSKFYLGKNTTKFAEVKYTVMAGGNVDIYTKKFEESGYIQDVLGYGLQTEGTIGSQILGLSLLGESETEGLDLLADFALIENPTGFFYEICIIDIQATGSEEFEFGGMILGYQKYEPQVTSYKNVI